MAHNEADTRVLLIEPRLQAAGWSGSQVTREHYYRRDQAYTDGRIYLRGDRARRAEPRRVDYLLRYSLSDWVARFEPGRDWLQLGIWCRDPADDRLKAARIAGEVLYRFEQLYPVYRFLLWGRGNDFRGGR